MVAVAGLSSLVSVVCLLSVVYDLASCEEESSGSLRLVNVVFRHGQRTPADTYPNDPHINFTFYPFGWGQLTNEGKVQQYQLGKFLRSRYNSFLGDVFTNNLLRVQSTDVDRTMMSAQLASAGLFPPTGFQKWNPDLDWQPIPVHSEPLANDSLLLVRISCPRYYEEMDSVKNYGEVKEYLNSLTGLYEALSQHSGLIIKDPDDVQSLYSTLLAELPRLNQWKIPSIQNILCVAATVKKFKRGRLKTQFNLTLPDWTGAFFPEKMAAVTAYSFTLNAYNDKLKQLKGGPLLKKILHDAESRTVDLHSKRKMFMYAGHDSTVANLLMALKVWDEQIPTYNIMAMIELHQENGIYGLKVFLRNSTEHEPYLLRVPGCEDLCPLDKVMELTKSVIPVDLKDECRSLDPSYVPPTPSGP